MELELRHLRAIMAIADAGSVGRAASELGYSQQALSTQLRRIENLLGEPLFDRNPNGVRPTAYGVEVVAQARDVLTRADAIGRPGGARGQAHGGTRRLVLRLAATNTPVLSGMVGRLRTGIPELGITVTSVYGSDQIVDLLETGQLDAAIGVDYPGLDLNHSAAVEHRAIITEPSFVAIPADHPLKHRLEVDLADLAGDDWFITPDDGAGWPGVFYKACEAAGFHPSVTHEFLGDRLQLLTMIADGLGVSLVQATTRAIPGVIIKPLVGTPMWCRYLLVWRRQTVTDQLAESLLDAATASYRDLIARSPHFQAWASRTFRGTLP